MTPPARPLPRETVIRLCLFVIVLLLGWSLTVARFPGARAPELESAATALQKSNPSEARVLFDKALAERPADPTLFVDILAECQKRSQWDLMIEYAERGVRACQKAAPGPRAALYSLLSSAYAEKEPVGRQENALTAAERALELQPQNPQMLNQLGYLLADNDRDLDRASAYIEAALRAVRRMDEPGRAALLSATEDSYGWVLFKKKNYASALSVLLQAIADLSEDETGATLKVMYTHLGMAYSKADFPAQARRNLEIALQYDKNYEPALRAYNALPPETLPAPGDSALPPAK